MNWRRVRLGELLENFSVRAKEIGGAEKLEFFGVSNEHGIIKTKNAAEEKGDDYKIIEKGCFAYNPYRINVGSIGMVNEDIRGLISPAYVVFKTKPRSIIPELLLKFLKSSWGLQQIAFFARGTVRQALRFEDLCNIELDIPDYDTQSELFSKLTRMEGHGSLLSTEFKDQVSMLKCLRQQILQDAMKGKLTISDESDEPVEQLLKKIRAEKEKLKKGNRVRKQELLSRNADDTAIEIPRSWAMCRLGEVVSMSRGKFSVRPRNDPNYFGGDYPFIQIGSLDENGSLIIDAPQTLNEKGAKVSKKFPKGTIAVAIVGGTIGNLGVLGREMYFPDSIVGILPSSVYNQDYVLGFLRAKQTEIKAEAYQMAGQPNIKIPTLENLLFPLPPLSEQARIVIKLKHLLGGLGELETVILESVSQNEMLMGQFLKEALRPSHEEEEFAQVAKFDAERIYQLGNVAKRLRGRPKGTG